MIVDDRTRVTIAPDVLVQPLEGESVLLNMQSGTYFGLNRVGTRMWDVLTTAPNLAHAIQTLVGAYDVPPATLRTDLGHLLQELIHKGLVRIETQS